jgi:hypothetical protein
MSDGDSRTERVLHPEFVRDLEALPLEEVRRRRDEAFAEREFQSYLRRLVQVRLDILSAEAERRRTGTPPQPLVDRLTAVMGEGPLGGRPSRGEALRDALSEDDLAEAERQADQWAGGAALARPETLEDRELEEALKRLRKGERAVSARRAAVLRVHDRLQEEVKRRYREDPSGIPAP